MDLFTLDYNKKQEVLLPEDAFFYLLEGGDLFGDEPVSSAKEILAQYPDGIYIEDTWEIVGDQVQCTIVPYTKNVFDYDEVIALTKYMELQIKWLDKDSIKVYRHNLKTAEHEMLGTFKVYTNKYGHRCFHTGDQDKEFTAGTNSLYYINHGNKRK